MKILIVGFGGHVRKNILPALKKLISAPNITICVRTLEKYREAADEAGVSLVDNYSSALSSDYDVIYIATPISSHFELAQEALQAGKHVWCEKPITITEKDAQKLCDIAHEKRTTLREICMYQFHAQFRELSKLISSTKDIIDVEAEFSIPHLEPSNIRYRRELGGGALLDLGFYPLSLMLSLFGFPKSYSAHVYARPPHKVDTYGCIQAVFDSLVFRGKWILGGPYKNYCKVNTESGEIFIDRVFSKPPTLVTSINNSAVDKKFNVAPDDHFFNMYSSFVNEIKNFSEERELKHHHEILQRSKLISSINKCV